MYGQSPCTLINEFVRKKLFLNKGKTEQKKTRTKYEPLRSRGSTYVVRPIKNSYFCGLRWSGLCIIVFLEKGSDQQFITLYTLYIYPSGHRQLIRYHPNPFREFPCMLIYIFIQKSFNIYLDKLTTKSLS